VGGGFLPGFMWLFFLVIDCAVDGCSESVYVPGVTIEINYSITSLITAYMSFEGVIAYHMMPLFIYFILLIASCDAFAPSSRLITKSTMLFESSEDWIPLVKDSAGVSSPVRKFILIEGIGELPSDGSSVEIEYTGSLVGEADWSSKDICECWLSQLQGLEHLSERFLLNNIDFSMLCDENVFTEEYCATALGIIKKIEAKKLIMARNRLKKSQIEYPAGTVFDSSAKRGKNFSFKLGKGAIRAIDLAVRSMREGEKAIVVCRADYGYGAEGLRSRDGTVIVPPFATLNFELKRIC